MDAPVDDHELRRRIAQLEQALAEARAESARLSERLEVVRRFGRLGTWERDIVSGRGRWDAGTLTIWGLDPAGPTPPLSETLSRIEPDERDAASRYYFDSFRSAGSYAFRFVIRRPDGALRRLHSQWVVLDGADGRPERAVGILLDETDPLAAATTASELQAQLATALDLADVLIWRHDLDAGRVHWSTSGFRTLGMVPRAEGLSLAEVRDLIHPEDLPRVAASAQEALDGDAPVDIEARYRHADGSWRWQLLRRLALRDDTGRPVAFLGIALDITERRARERQAEAMARRFETVTRAAGIGSWVNEVERGRIEWSPETRRIHGLGPDEPLPGTRAWLETWVHPEDRARMREVVATTLSDHGERGLDVPFRIVRRDGEVRHLTSHTQVEHDETGPVVFGVLIDVTERLRAESALRAADTRITLALGGVGIGTWEIDLASRRTLWDEQMWRLRGLEPEPEAPDLERLYGWLHPDDRAPMLERYLQSEASGEPLDTEFRVVWPDGRVRWLASRALEVDDGGGRRRRIGVNWDVTVRLEAERARQAGELARRESQAKSKFLARMSHELRTPLNAVLGFAQLMQVEESGIDAASKRRRGRLEHIRVAGAHLLSLIDDVLTLTGAEGGELRMTPRLVALAPLAHEVLTMLAPQAQARHLVLSQDCGAWQVQADPTRLRQVLLNLAGNAVKYNREGGRVTLTASGADGRVVIEVADDGPGLDAQQQQHLFEPFNRLGAEDGPVEGHGIGLAIVKALVERMGGSVAVDSAPGAGSRFRVSLPEASATAEAAEAEAAPAALPGAAPPAQRHGVLYIEDNPVNALIIRELLAPRRDLELTVAAAGEPGLALARERRPALVLLDMQLPDIDGLEVLRRLKADAATAATPVIVLSANAMPEDIRRALAAGARDYWTKPLDFAQFRAGIEALFGPARA